MRPHIIVVAIVAICGLSSAAAAQDVPVVFVHGLAADQTTWQSSATRLQQQLALRPYLARVPWRETFEAQAGRLQADWGFLPPSTIAVGHSNGGLASRQWSLSHGLGGLVTVGTPNAGAPVVDNLLRIIHFNQILYNAMGLAAGSFGVQPNEWNFVFVFVQAAIVFGQQLSAGSITGLVAGLGLNSAFPVIPQMSTGSYLIGQLNSAANIAREQGAIGRRVGLVYVAHNYSRMGPARAIDPENADRYYNEMWTAIGTLELAGAYLSANYPYNGTAAWIANALFTAAYWLRQVDPVWCDAVTNDSSCGTWHDGILPTNNQLLPGAPNVLVMGPAHKQEAKTSEPVSFALTNYVGVAPRGVGSTLPPSTGGGDELAAGQSLFPGQKRTSSDGRFELAFQTDGNLVLYRLSDGAALWATGTYAPDGEAAMQSDGNLVVYDAAGVPRWSSGTANFAGAHLVVQSDGNLVIYDYYGVPIWATGTVQ